MAWGLCLICIWSFNPLLFGVVPTFSAVSGILYFKDSVLLSAENNLQTSAVVGEQQ